MTYETFRVLNSGLEAFLALHTNQAATAIAFIWDSPYNEYVYVTVVTN